MSVGWASDGRRMRVLTVQAVAAAAVVRIGVFVECSRRVVRASFVGKHRKHISCMSCGMAMRVRHAHGPHETKSVQHALCTRHTSTIGTHAPLMFHDTCAGTTQRF